MNRVVFGFLGATLDQGFRAKRWEQWRPSVSICQHTDFTVDDYHLFYPGKAQRLVELIENDILNVSPDTTVYAHAMDFQNAWDFEEVYSGLHDFISTFDFQPETNDYLFHITTGTHVAQICIFLLTESRFFPGMLLQSGPARDRNPIGEYSIIDLDLSKYDKIASRFAQQFEDDVTFLKSGIDTRNADFNRLVERIELVALRSSDPMLLEGPTGAGKSKLASRIYELKKNKSLLQGDFVQVNCATLRGDAAMSTLFGHKRGAFTGAIQDRAGLLKAANKGILFLDEVSELGLDEQAMLLRAIEEKQFMSVGSDRETGSDFQLMCGTNKDLNAAVRQGRFREDLLSRINLWVFELPGLKSRPEDIEPNIDYELRRYTQRTGDVATFNKESRKLFLNFAVSSQAVWTANFRDLIGAVLRMCTLAQGGRITSDIVRDEIERLRAKWRHAERESSDMKNAQVLLGDERWNRIDPFDQPQLARVIRICRQKKSLSEAGRVLFRVSRQNKKKPNDADRLRKYLARFALDWKSINEN